ncbi:metallophosphoesterase family protein [Primorskyibacter sp. S187A]|uniref:metallophosphoesterase family protein n=1 Tax=Primorskyibacter sp. S187A TaxID=3415130 RepID=UPI003C7A73F0
MRIKEIGALSGEIVVFGGVYSNAQALTALLAAKGERTAICTGDIVAYGADAEDCVQAMRQSGIPSIAGNCELQLAADAEDCGCGFQEGTTCDRLSMAWYAHARRDVSQASRAWMNGLPDCILFEAHGRRVAVLHGATSDVSRFMWSTTPEEEFTHEINILNSILYPNSGVDVVLSGHSGIPFQREIDGVTWVNAGAIGMPANNGSSDTFYTIMSENGFEFRPLPYDWRAAQQAMRAAGLTQGYDHALESGYWPSEDVLPPDLRVVASG